ncbi:MAG: glycosyltransferase family 4 protein [Candidatus Moranbacteria bacterium]|nr:glycosyltransferase family 4 protein [Candidatus Moranbacteria bacterium]
MHNTHPRIAIIHDFLLYPGGAERVLVNIARIFPDAPIYTLLCDKKGLARIDASFEGSLSHRDIRQTFLGKFPSFLRKRYRLLSPLFPSAIESLDLRDFDVVISSSGAWSKGIVTRTYTKHIAYIHSPMRFVWDYNERYWKERKEKPSLVRRLFLSYLRVWDAQAADRPDILLANSFYTKKRISKYYRRESEVLYPGIFSGKEGMCLEGNDNNKKHFLIVSRLASPKRVDLAIEVCNRLRLPLVVVGDGPEMKNLKKSSGETIHFTGWIGKKDLENVYKKSRAFLFPCQDDFGIAPVEAMLRGIPVIAVPGASAPEIIGSDQVGVLCDAFSMDGLADGIRRFLEKEKSFSPKKIRYFAEKFSQKKFEQSLKKIVYGN